MPRSKKAKHTESTFNDTKDNEPEHIAAHADCIVLHVNGQEIILRPRHIDVIHSMFGDWWDSHWAAVHEREA